MTDAGTDKQPAGEPNASALCLACGLCCNGVLHADVPVHVEHVTLVRRLGLTVEADEAGGWRFRQPCPLYRDDTCSVYVNRPPSCQSYRCALLRRYDNGDATLEEALAIVRTARSLIGKDSSAAAQFVTERRLLADTWSGDQQPAAPADARPDDQFALRAAAVKIFLQQHFRVPASTQNP